MGSFLEEIIKGGLGNVFGNAGGSTSGGGLEDILKDMTGGQSTTTTTAVAVSAPEVLEAMTVTVSVPPVV